MKPRFFCSVIITALCVGCDGTPSEFYEATQFLPFFESLARVASEGHLKKCWIQYGEFDKALNQKVHYFANLTFDQDFTPLIEFASSAKVEYASREYYLAQLDQVNANDHIPTGWFSFYDRYSRNSYQLGFYPLAAYIMLSGLKDKPIRTSISYARYYKWSDDLSASFLATLSKLKYDSAKFDEPDTTLNPPF